MRLLLDQNLSYKLVARWSDIFPESAHIRDFGLTEASDVEVWEVARRQGYVVTSKDVDFESEGLFPGPPPKYLRLLIGNASTQDVDRFVRERLEEIAIFEASDARMLVLD